MYTDENGLPYAVVSAMKNHPSISYQGKFATLHAWLFGSAVTSRPVSLPAGLDGEYEYNDYFDGADDEDDNGNGNGGEVGGEGDNNNNAHEDGEAFAPGTPR